MNQFKYISPENKEETLKILKEEEVKACIVAGSTNVLPDIKIKKLSPKILVDIIDIEEFVHYWCQELIGTFLISKKLFDFNLGLGKIVPWKFIFKYPNNPIKLCSKTNILFILNLALY